MTFTPGPWSVIPCSAGGMILLRGGKERGDHPQTHLQIVPTEDARLIAAAPKMYALLRNVLDGGMPLESIEATLREIDAT